MLDRLVSFSMKASFFSAFLLSAVSCDSAIEVRVPAGLEATAGQVQEATVGESLPSMLSVRVVDAEGKPVSGVDVSWSVDTGGGSVEGEPETSNEGVAEATWTLGTTAGTQQARAEVTGLAPLLFTAIAAPGDPAELVVISGGGQTGRPGLALQDSLIVKVLDQHGNPIEGWAIECCDGDGSFSPSSRISDSEGRAAFQWVLGEVKGIQDASATVDRLEHLTADFAATSEAFEVLPFAVTLSGGYLTSEMWADSVRVQLDPRLPNSAESVLWEYSKTLGCCDWRELSREEEVDTTFSVNSGSRWTASQGMSREFFLRTRLTVTERSGAVAVVEDTIVLPVFHAYGTVTLDDETWDVNAASWHYGSGWNSESVDIVEYVTINVEGEGRAGDLLLNISSEGFATPLTRMQQSGHFSPAGIGNFFLALGSYDTSIAIQRSDYNPSSGTMNWEAMEQTPGGHTVILGLDLEATVENYNGIRKTVTVNLNWVPHSCYYTGSAGC